MSENFCDIVVKIKSLAEKTQGRSKELKHLTSFGENLSQRMESISRIFGDQDFYEEIEKNAGLNEAALVILYILENEVKPFLNGLSKGGLEATAEAYVNVKDYTEKYWEICGILDGAILVLNEGLDIKQDITSNKISEESLAVKKELEDIKNTLCGILKQSQERSENIANLEQYVCNLDRSISDLHECSDLSPKEMEKINKKFYYRCARSKSGLALSMTGDLDLNGDEVNTLQKTVQPQQAVYIQCAFGETAGVLPAGNSAAIQGAISLFKHLKEKDRKETRELSLGIPDDTILQMNKTVNNKQKSSSNFEKNGWSFSLCCFTLFSYESNACNGKSGDDVELPSPNRCEQ